MSEANLVWKAEGVSAGYSAIEGTVRDVTLSIRHGERVALLGQEKSGRSLVLRVLAALRPVREGQLEILGEKLRLLPYWADWNEILSTEKRRKMGVCLEREGLLSNVTAREGLEMLFRFKYGDHNLKLREGSKRVVDQLAVRFGVMEVLDRRPHELTAAERKLVGLARAFLSKPSVIVMENPSENVGNIYRKRLLSVVEEICSQPERTVLVSTDDWPLAYRFCERWIVMKDGMIAFDGKPQDFLATQDELAEQISEFIQRMPAMHEELRKAV